MTCLPKLLTASAVLAASLLGGCSDNLFSVGGQPPAPPPVAAQPPQPAQSSPAAPQAAAQPAPHQAAQPAAPLAATTAPPAPEAVQPAVSSPAADQAGTQAGISAAAAPATTAADATVPPMPPQAIPEGASLMAAAPAVSFTAVGLVPPAAASSPPQPVPPVPAAKPMAVPPAANGERPDQRLASAALDDQDLAQVRGGFEANSGVVLNFAFQQATFVNHDLAQTIVVPTLTISPGQGGTSIAGTSATGVSPPNVNVSSLTGLGVSAQSQSAIAGAKLLPNGTVQTQISAAAPVIQTLVNSGMASIVSSFGNGGLTSVITNTANNRVVQQTTTIDIGVSGLSSLMRQSVPASVLNRLSGPNLFR